MFTPNEFIDACIGLIEGGSGPTGIEQIVKKALISQARDPLAWDVGELLYRSAKLTIVNVELPGGGRTPLHDHGMWAVIGISQGCEVDRFFESGPTGLVEVGHVAIECGQTAHLDATVLHSIENPHLHVAKGVHVYGGDLGAVKRRMWDPYTGMEMVFDSATFERWTEEISITSASNISIAPMIA